MGRYDILTKDFLEKEYIINKKPCYIIGAETNCEYRIIVKKLKEYNINLRRGGRCAMINLTGKRFRNLLVLRENTEKQRKRPYWDCQCLLCNTFVTLSSENVNNGSSKFCKCTIKWGYEEISGNHWTRIKTCANKRNIEFNITIEYIWDLFIKQDGICALSGKKLILTKKFKTASLDRIDSLKGYIKSNVQWIYKDLQYLKSDFPENEFFDWIKRIYEYKQLNLINTQNIPIISVSSIES